ncbi:hypothetical protein P280DRAFT_464539 [Massarina eburnea CBS 473.64]|uniref:Uncharacterized protein n=1 Tax=Massarina eburnea CBS 473.64 TaxID=1395130 RepID=A0A6A6SHY7_9PLEO|nr:hypothetical protein P280DRAFT_464539 [Massarina eburnea CBS 473.64]
MSTPILFTLPPSNRHEVILVDASAKPSLKALNKQITSTIAASPNCAEFMNKYKSKEGTEQIQEFKVHWSTSGRETKSWPEYTIVTEENWAAILKLFDSGKDVLEIKVGKDE